MIPKIIYGTAWKELRTQELVQKALKAGFRGMDTANQRKHYYEEGVGAAVALSGIPRNELFLQSKFTYVQAQDHRLPYSKNSDFTAQVTQSFESTLLHLKTDHLDSYLLHGPSTPYALTYDDLTVWKALEQLHESRKALMIGISNVSIKQLKTLYEKAKHKPKIVQNRCYASTGWDKEVREFCKENKIIYQGFSLLTANPQVFPKAAPIAKRCKKTEAQVILRFSQQIGIVPLTGTTDERHMSDDLDLDFDLSADEIDTMLKAS